MTPRALPATTRWRPRRPRLVQPLTGFLSLLMVVAAGMMVGGCSHSLEPPRTVADPVNVLVIDYGRHAGLALPQDNSNMVEWSWGDWNWFALERTGVLNGVQALFASPRSTLSRRELGRVNSNDALAARLGAEQILPLKVERERASALHQQLTERWLRRRDEAVTSSAGRVFVPDDARYSLTNNSVHELSRWLQALDVRVRGSGVTADFTLRGP